MGNSLIELPPKVIQAQGVMEGGWGDREQQQECTSDTGIACSVSLRKRAGLPVSDVMPRCSCRETRDPSDVSSRDQLLVTDSSPQWKQSCSPAALLCPVSLPVFTQKLLSGETVWFLWQQTKSKPAAILFLKCKYNPESSWEKSRQHKQKNN